MITLTEAEELGLKTLSLLRLQQLDAFKCDSCNEETREKRNCCGCESHDTPVYYNEHVGEFYSCPLNFIPDSIIEFADRYDYYEKYPSAAPEFEDVNPRYWASVKFYESFKYKVMNKDNKDKIKGGGAGDTATDENLAKMRALFKKKEVNNG